MACREFDGQVVRLEDEIENLADRFIRVRLTAMDAVDLGRFQFDYDMTWAAFFLNADGCIYGRYGTRDSEPYSAHEQVSTAGLARAMARALALHEGYPTNREQLLAKQPRPVEWRTVEEVPARRRMGFGACYHCHHVAEALLRTAIDRGDPLSPAVVWPYPTAEHIGLRLDARDDVLVISVLQGTPAARAGLLPGDRLLSVDGAPLVAQADLQWALHLADDAGASVRLRVDRDGASIDALLGLSAGWRRSGGGWRESRWRLRPGVAWQRIDDVEERAQLRLGEGMALRVTRVYGAAVRKDGLLRGDVMVALDDNSADVDEGEMLLRLRRDHRPGERVPVELLRDGERIHRDLILD